MDGGTLGQVLAQDDCIRQLLAKEEGLIAVYTLEDLSTVRQVLKEKDTIALVVNTALDPNKTEGEHWVGLYADKSKPDFDYFDSLGAPPTKQVFYSFFNRQQRAWAANIQPLQDPLSSVCGYYCLFFLFMRCRGHSMKDITLTFSDDFAQNDTMVQNYIHEHYSLPKIDKFQHLKQLIKKHF